MNTALILLFMGLLFVANLPVVNKYNIEEFKNIQISEHMILCMCMCMCKNKYKYEYRCEKYDGIYANNTHYNFKQMHHINNKYFYVEIIRNDSNFLKNKFEIIGING